MDCFNTTFADSIECLGRRLETAISVAHLLIMYGSLVSAYIIFAFFVQIRRMRRRRHYMGIPRTEMRIGEEHLSRRAHRGCIKGISKSLDQLRVLGPPMSVAGDPGWEPSPVDRFGKRNYDADVARSLSELERTAIGRDPALARRPDQDAAQYVAMLRTALPTVPDGLFQQYLQNYEAARYSENAVVGPQFQSFVQALEELHAGIAGAPLVAGLTSREGWASAMSPG